jgi:hypothetical protein
MDEHSAIIVNPHDNSDPRVPSILVVADVAVVIGARVANTAARRPRSFSPSTLHDASSGSTGNTGTNGGTIGIGRG